jgi:hypothetical protein
LHRLKSNFGHVAIVLRLAYTLYGVKNTFLTVAVLGSSFVLAQPMSTGKYLVSQADVKAVMNALCESQMDTAKLVLLWDGKVLKPNSTATKLIAAQGWKS